MNKTRDFFLTQEQYSSLLNILAQSAWQEEEKDTRVEIYKLLQILHVQGYGHGWIM